MTDPAASADSTTDRDTDPTAAAVVVLAADMLLRWGHRRGARTHCLARLRVLAPGATTSAIPGLAVASPGGGAVVVLSELRGNPRGYALTADVAGAANTAVTALIPRAWAPAEIAWFVHHGSFSTYDDAGPDTLTHVPLDQDAHSENLGYRGDDVHAHTLLPTAHAAALADLLHLGPVEPLLRTWGWGPPATSTTGPRDPSAPSGPAVNGR